MLLCKQTDSILLALCYNLKYAPNKGHFRVNNIDLWVIFIKRGETICICLKCEFRVCHRSFLLGGGSSHSGVGLIKVKCLPSLLCVFPIIRSIGCGPCLHAHSLLKRIICLLISDSHGKKTNQQILNLHSYNNLICN